MRIRYSYRTDTASFLTARSIFFPLLLYTRKFFFLIFSILNFRFLWYAFTAFSQCRFYVKIIIIKKLEYTSYEERFYYGFVVKLRWKCVRIVKHVIRARWITHADTVVFILCGYRRRFTTFYFCKRHFRHLVRVINK